MSTKPGRIPVPDAAARRAPASGGLLVETETMPDGRRIHYYSWPGATEPAPRTRPERGVATNREGGPNGV